MSEQDAEIKLINLEKIDNEELNSILSKYFIEGEIDSDGDIIIRRSSRIYVKVDKEQQALRIFSFIQLKSETNANSNALKERIELRNRASSTIKYSIMEKSIMGEYGIYLSGYIDHKLLIKTLDKFESEMAFLKIIISAHSKG